MKLDAISLEALAEIRRYPALLARLSQVGVESGTQQWPARQLLGDVLEGALPADGDSSTFARLLEDGEIAAANKFHELAGFGKRERMRITTRRSACQQQLQQVRRRVMGLQLLLKGTEEESLIERGERIRKLEDDEQARELRPGWVIRRLRAEEAFLEEVIANEINVIQQEYQRLLESSQNTQNRDLAQALQRLGQELRSRENLPTARKMLHLARRAKDGTLSRDDLKSLHHAGHFRQRVVRPWVDFDLNGVPDAAGIARQFRQPKSFPEIDSPAVRDEAISLFEALSVRRSRLDVEAAAEQLFQFLGLNGDLSRPVRSRRGALYTVEFGTPRVASFRSSRFGSGIQLIIPSKASPSTIAELLKQAPDDCFPIVYYPGRLNRSLMEQLRLADDVAHFDNYDLLRLCEAPMEQRELGFQQVILPRSPFHAVKPWQLGGPVSAEMFKGRRAVIESLKDEKGSTVLFSGRMMGKSSILDRIYRDIESDSTQPLHRAIKISNARAQLFRALTNELADLLPPAEAKRVKAKVDRIEDTSAQSPAQKGELEAQRLNLIGKVLDTFFEQEGARLWILIDEADRFAADDARKPRDHSLAWLLRDREFNDPGRLRVVFAGFQTIHNQVIAENGAFANWFGIEQLSTLEDSDARALIVEPFADFAFSFASEAGVDRILEFTGGHPLLIQEVCARLMERTQARRTGSLEDEVITIEAGDVEVVCRDDQLRDRLHQVLSLNLNENPRLKLMVYLILYSCGTGSESTLRLEDFSLASLKAELLKWYGEQFNDYFDEKNIGALIARLKALGLIRSHGARYEFVNQTFARMLLESPTFEQTLEELLSYVTDPVQGQHRRFVTLPNEHLERVTHNRESEEKQNLLFIGLPETRGDYIAKKLFGQADSGGEDYREAEALNYSVDTRVFLLSGAECESVEDVRAVLKRELKETRKTLSLADFMVKNNLETLVITQADKLAASGALLDISRSLNERDRYVFAFGGAPLARAYVGRLFAENFDTIRLERLRAADIVRWGHRFLPQEEDHAIIFDDHCSRDVRRATGGYLPLVREFAEFVRRNHQTAREYLPSPEDVKKFEKVRQNETIRQALLSELSPVEAEFIGGFYRFAAAEDLWAFERELVENLVLPHLREALGLDAGAMRDALEVLQLLDLIGRVTEEGARLVQLDMEGPLARLYGAGEAL